MSVGFKVTDVAPMKGSASLLIENNGRFFMYDMGFGFCAEQMEKNAFAVLGGKMPECIIISHSHYDHVMGLTQVSEKWDDIPVISGEYAAYVFTRPGAKKTMYEMDVNASYELTGEKCSLSDRTDRLRSNIPVKDNEVIDVCGLELKCMYLPGHTKCSVGFYCEEYKTLFSSETLGVYGAGTNQSMPILLTSFRDGEVSLERVLPMDIENIVMPHFGLLEGRDNCMDYFRSSVEEFSWMKKNVTELHNSGRSIEYITEIIRERYFRGPVEKLYPLKAFYLNTGYMVPVIINEYC